MRHLRPFPALIALAVIGAACSGPAASSGGNQSQAEGASQGAGASQPAASTGGGGGGGGGGGNGANGSLHYEITGDVSKSGDVDFFNQGGFSQFSNGGWVAYFNNTDSSVVVQISSMPSGESAGYGDGEITIVGTSADCSFDWSKNDAGGLKGTIDCADPTAFNSTSAGQIHVHFRATVDAHT
jgi:hypothetical protein